ncbi:aminodeoxychorismate synthase component I [Novosphingopyxis sp.]|uniref:aminodeoxychorismate synthase component I n=1 Tax=Novosphingopyxis sp. TaxID=2709690 RepID=UPI003B597BAA
MLPSTGQPFVLLDDARPGGAKARLYRDPLRVLRADRPDELAPLLEALGAASADGLHAAGYLAYEAGLALEPRLAHRLPTDQPSPLGWFGLFKRYEMFDAMAWPDPAGAWLSDFTPDITRGEYDAAFAEAIALIEAGDIYQANLTFRTHAGFAGDPRALFAALRDRAGAGYGALVHDGVDWLLSFSPELFFSLKGRAVRVKPMKGTAARLTDPVADAAAAKTLAADPKQRAENLMIVDLLRNDLSRICVPGSVVTGPLFAVETYPTVHQLVSTVRGTLAGSHNAVDLIANLFPCGSITGAPKIRAMEVIGELETSARGPYCGAIGRIDADGDAAFNVAIRTLCLKAGVRSVSLGLGSGVVADSLAGTEWAECLAKGGFARMKTSFDLIETMAFDPHSGLIRIERHLERLKDSARTFGFECDRHQLRNDLHAATFQLAEPSKVRLLLARSGASAIEIRPAPLHPERGWRVGLSPLPVGAEDVRLAHKTSDRDFYDAGRRAHPEWDEVLFTDPQGFLTEGSYSSLFVERGGLYHTPPLTRGLLPGVLRAELLETGQAVEADLRPEDLEKGFLCGNSLRGLVTSRLVAPN